MRFEVLKQDAEGHFTSRTWLPSEAETRGQLMEELKQLDMDFAFVAGCNEGLIHGAGECGAHQNSWLPPIGTHPG